MFKTIGLILSFLFAGTFAATKYYNPMLSAYHGSLDSTRAIELGLVQGMTFDTKFGYNADLDTAAEEVIGAQGGTFQIPTGAETLSLVSTSTEDNASGTGARFVRVVCVLADGTETNVDFVPTGTTDTVSTEECIYVNRVTVLSSGSAQGNVGDISVRQTTSGIIFRTVPTGDSISQSCSFYVKTGSKILVENLKFSVVRLGSGAPEVIIYSNVYIPSLNTTFRSLRASYDSSAAGDIKVEYPFTQAISAGAYVWFSAETDTNNTFITCRSNLLTIDVE